MLENDDDFIDILAPRIKRSKRGLYFFLKIWFMCLLTWDFVQKTKCYACDEHKVLLDL
jgi:hypothetical protein